MSPKGDSQGEDFLDFELEIGAGSGRAYPVAVVRSAAGEARGMMQFPYDELVLKNQLLTLQNALLSSADGRRHVRPEEQNVQDFGRSLYNTLFTGEVGNLYAISQREADQQSKGLRIKLRILSPEMAALPWEFLYDPGHDEYVCLSRKTPLIRYIELPEPPQPLSVALPLRILGMIATPINLPPLDVKREQLRMEKALEPLQQRGLVQLTWLAGQTWRDVQQAMREGPWHIFHFIGHGRFDTLTDEGQIAFADDQGQADLLQATQLGRLLSDHFPLRLVVLNACEGAMGGQHDVFSSAAANLVRHGIPAVVAMQFAITDDAAIEFSRTFYEALSDNLPIDAAVSEARKAVSMCVKDTLEWGVPVLFMRSPDGKLFTISQGHTPTLRQPPEPLTFPQETPAPAMRQLPPQPAVEAPPITEVPLPVHREVSRGRLLLLVALVCLVVVGSVGVGVIFWISNNTQTHIPVSTVTATAPKNPYPPYQGTLVLNDPLKDASKGNGWEDDKPFDPNNNSLCAFTGDGYLVHQITIENNENITYCLADKTSFRNFIYEIQMTITKGDFAGISFYDDNGKNYYYFGIRQDGYYEFTLYEGNRGGAKTVLAKGTISPLGTGPNQIAVITSGDLVDLYVNYHQLTTVTLPNNITFGQVPIKIGVFVEIGEQDLPTEAVFRNAKVWAL
jgi:CHAT domain-containing protein